MAYRTLPIPGRESQAKGESFRTRSEDVARLTKLTRCKSPKGRESCAVFQMQGPRCTVDGTSVGTAARYGLEILVGRDCGSLGERDISRRLRRSRSLSSRDLPFDDLACTTCSEGGI